eukprot:TRINITY_DN122180_c0_g1_i1.p1 TRINITY_DN122180_c0_g1~~TRINITY_DN122180_c0_g1_i1.p1  ORF type:complete len:364 (-),score=49.88 TRINITY_DN122180_c0_g1_i1:199-1290(-)
MTSGDSQPSLCGIQAKWYALAFMVLQNNFVVIMARISRTHQGDGPPYLSSTLVFFSECVKLLCSLLFLRAEAGSFASVRLSLKEHIFGNPSELLRVSVPGLLYCVNNNLLFIGISNLSAAIYQVTSQLKILSTTVLSVLILGRQLEPTKWGALFVLTCGVVLIQLPQQSAKPTGDSDAQGNAFVGLTAVLSACVTSGLAGVLLEKMLKQSDASIWVRNVQLAIVGAAIGLVSCFVVDGQKIGERGFMQGYNITVIAVILGHAVGGLLVAAVLKYADNILKCIGNALSMTISSALSALVLQEFVPEVYFMVGTGCVIASSMVYNLGLPPFCSAPLQEKYEVVQQTEFISIVGAQDADTDDYSAG